MLTFQECDGKFALLNNKSADFFRRLFFYAVNTIGVHYTFKDAMNPFMFSIIHKITGIFKASAVELQQEHEILMLLNILKNVVDVLI